MELNEAGEQAMRVRALYERLEVAHHGAAWTGPELMVGLMQDLGDLGRLVMSAEMPEAAQQRADSLPAGANWRPHGQHEPGLPGP